MFFLNTGFCGTGENYNSNRHQDFNIRVLTIKKGQPLGSLSVVSYNRVRTVLKRKTKISNVEKFLIYQIKKHFFPL